MAITPLPSPPSRSTPDTFSDLADAFLGALPAFAIEANALAAAMNLNDVISTSTTELTIGTGVQNLAVQTDKSYQPGMYVVIAYTTTPTILMYGTVTSYNATTGAMVVSVIATSGSGTQSEWTITLSGPVGKTGLLPIAVAGGSADAITADYDPNLTLADTILCAIVAAYANATTTPTFAPDGLTAHTIVKKGGTALVAGDIPGAGAVCLLEYNLANTRWELLNPASVPATGLPMGYGYMPPLTHGADTEHDIVIPACKWRDSTDAADIVLASALTKQADAAWAVGSTEGGMDTGSIPASGTLHVWLIKRTDTGVVDALFSISATAPTMPANYDIKRLIGSYRTNSSSNIINGYWFGTGVERTFMYNTPIKDVDTAGTVARVATAASIPAGLKIEGLFILYVTGGANVYQDTILTSLDSTDVAPDSENSIGFNGMSGWVSSEARCLTNTSAQIGVRSRIAAGTTKIHTRGYRMFL